MGFFDAIAAGIAFVLVAIAIYSLVTD